MHHDYQDIRGLTDKVPVWFDENAVPRYCVFEPDEIADIYADEAVLMLITCQACGTEFNVALSQNRMREFERNGTLADDIQAKAIHFGDPPNTGCCPAGPTMNSEPRRILQYWRRHHQKFVKDGVVTDVGGYIQWNRYAELELDVTPAWVTRGYGI